MARPWVLAAAALCLAALGPHSAALAAGGVSRRGAGGGAALLENAKNCIFMFQARLHPQRVRATPRHAIWVAQSRPRVAVLRRRAAAVRCAGRPDIHVHAAGACRGPAARSASGCCGAAALFDRVAVGGSHAPLYAASQGLASPGGYYTAQQPVGQVVYTFWFQFCANMAISRADLGRPGVACSRKGFENNCPRRCRDSKTHVCGNGCSGILARPPLLQRARNPRRR